MPREMDEQQPLPSFSEQVSSQLGGVRGMFESAVPIVVFVLANMVWSLRPAILAAVGVAAAIGVYRYWRKQSVRHATNGVFGVGLGALIAWRSGEASDFYLPTVWANLAYGVALLGSIAAGRPLVGWLWSVVADKGGTRWYRDERLRRMFSWLTVLWSAVFLAKFAGYQWVLHDTDLTSNERNAILGTMKVALGAPPYALLLALTIWAVRRYHQRAGNEPVIA